MARESTGSLLGAIYVLIGAILLGSALFAPWYEFDSYSDQYWGLPGGGGMVSIGPSQLDFYLNGLPGIWAVQTSCPSGNVTNFCPASSSYSDAGLNSTGVVTAITSGLAAAGFATASLAGILGLRLRGRPRRGFPELTLAFVAVALAIVATTAYALLLPGAFAHDIPQIQRGYESSGPWSSFSGATTFIIPMPCPSPGCAVHAASWGPSIGWCLAVAAIAVLLVGAAMMVRYRHNLPEPAMALSVPSTPVSDAT